MTAALVIELRTASQKYWLTNESVNMHEREMTHWPGGKQFAFTFLDDTDRASLQNVRAVYELLSDLGILGTKSVWMLEPGEEPRIPGVSCEDREYLAYVQSLQSRGYEICLHNVSSTTSRRAKTILGIREFEKAFGHLPFTLANHAGNRESVYWGIERFTGWRRTVYGALSAAGTDQFEGHVEGSLVFWGDVCRESIQYVRNWVFNDINTLKLCPFMPYHDPTTPYVNDWFCSSNGATISQFLDNFTQARIDQLADEGGLSIVYTHFCSFSDDGVVNGEFRRRMEYLSRQNAWFTTVHQVLDHLRGAQKSDKVVITPTQRSQLEEQWLRDRMVSRVQQKIHQILRRAKCLRP